MIHNLSQLKRAISEKQEFIIVSHRINRFEGKKRRPSIVQTNGFYSIVPDIPEDETNKANGGKGSWCEFGKASQWKFEHGECRMYLPNLPHTEENRIWIIKFVKE